MQSARIGKFLGMGGGVGTGRKRPATKRAGRFRAVDCPGTHQDRMPSPTPHYGCMILLQTWAIKGKKLKSTTHCAELVDEDANS